ncbi:hypothetical protein [Siphonobacter sp. SORGH_AS_0500]|uniref:hypothetical protein n=1 Tax=Siphonobacter sp. SORGH_AS_0500 TaxID=1864824 RepID=UPI0012FE8CC9|nr:hypothetical protein [Siphonobacter sp. SORGH_AS_0500]
MTKANGAKSISLWLRKSFASVTWAKATRFIHGLEAAQKFCVGKDLTDKKNQLNEKLAGGSITPAEHKSLMAEITDEESAKKLPELIMCSGGSDALNTAAMGYWVLWRNSETEELNYPEHKKIMEVCNTLYNLPDIDETGKLAGHKLALQFLEMKTIWLPERMLEQRDSEGKPRHKDLRDFLKLYSQEEPHRTHNKYDFDQLVKTALPYQFWDEHQETDSDGNPKYKFNRPIMKYAVNNLRLYNFLHRCGFGRLEDKAEKTKYTYTRVEKNIVKSIEPSTIKDFVNEFLESRAAVEDLRNTFYRSPHLSETSFSNLPLMKLEFKGHAADRQYLFFEKSTWKITAEQIEEVKQEMSGKNVWESKVLQIPGQREKIRIDEPYFKIVKKDNVWDIDILNKNVAFLNFLIQTARVHWREELEYRLDFFNSFPTDKKRQEYEEKHELGIDLLSQINHWAKAENQEEYRKNHLFSIDGPLLKPDEIQEQKLFLINRIFCIGYILHRHKFKSKPWAVFAMDNRLSEDGVANGGAGKSIVTDALQLVLANKLSKEKHIETIKGRSDTINTYDFVFEGITTKTDLVLVDDVSPSMDFKTFYEPLTTDWKVNRRNRGYETIAFADSPKVWFNSNYGDKYMEGSDTRRKIVTAYSDYYHDNPHNFYRETRTPANDFKKQLFEEWNPEEWTTFYNLAAQCIQFYLSTDEKIKPPITNINKRNLLTVMGENFLSWADVFFDENGSKVNQLVVKDEAQEDFQRSANFTKITSQSFKNRLKAWAAYRGHTLNPEELTNKDGRIVRKPLNYDITKEMIYVQTAGATISVTA